MRNGLGKYEQFFLYATVMIVCSSSIAQELLSMLPREWTSTSGRFSISATFIEANGETVTLLRADNGRRITISLDRLSKADQAFVAEQVKAAVVPPKPAAPANTETLTGKVIAVMDGDIVLLLTENKSRVKIRLEGIDAPESGQPFGQKSKQAISDAVHGKQVTILVSGQDRYRRTLGIVMVGKVNANLELVRQGLAWHYAAFSNDKALAAAQQTARAAGIRPVFDLSPPIVQYDSRTRLFTPAGNWIYRNPRTLCKPEPWMAIGVLHDAS